MGKLLDKVLGAGPRPRIRNFGDPPPSEEELLRQRLVELREVLRSWEHQVQVLQEYGQQKDAELEGEVQCLHDVIEVLKARLADVEMKARSAPELEAPLEGNN